MKVDAVERRLQLLRLLAEGGFRSGEKLAAMLGISRAAVWKLVDRIRAGYGIRIDAVRGKGYRLGAPLELLDPGSIHEQISDTARSALPRLIIHDQIGSTNTWLMQRISEDLPSGTVCLAEQQTSGRGRHGRAWVSPFGRNLYLSVLWRFPFPPAYLSGLSLAAGVGTALALTSVGATGVGLKWPNDLLWNRRKLGGLLLEVVGEAQGPASVVCGIGINISLSQEDASSIDQPWTDLDQALAGQTVGRNALAARVLEQMVWVMSEYERRRLESFLPLWRQLDPFLGQPIELRIGDKIIRGTHAGIDDAGALRLAHDRGITHFLAGEVTLRALS